ncbi:MAG: TonB-dependent receptor [Bacteroidetes bacterium]|nr:TonB-dependent receptor [Bacteroidota bacterium]
MSPHLCRLAFLSLLITSSLFAQQNDSRPHDDMCPLYEMDDSVVVVANRYASPLARETNAIAVISGTDIVRYADHSLLELVQWEVPSAYLAASRVGGFGVGTAGTGMISLRGMGGKPNTGVAVMIDGHPDFMGIFGHPLPDVYGMDDIERVDVLLGPASTVFGGSALGGVINIVSRTAANNSVRSSIEGGTWGTYSASLSVSRRYGAHGFQISAGYNRSDGHLPQTGFEGSRLQAGWEWRIDPTWQLSLRGRYVPYSFDDPSRTPESAALDTYGEIRRGMGQLILQNASGALSGSTQAYFNAGHHEFCDGFVSDDQSLGLSTYQQWRVGTAGSIAAGGDILRYGGEANLDGVEHLMNTGGVYALGMYSPLDFLHLRAGLRWQSHSLGHASIAPTLGVSVVPLQGWRVYASMQSGFRDPTLRELYLFPSSNPALTEERSTGYEVGTELAVSRASLRIAAFRTHASDMITTVANALPPPPVRFQNALDAQQWGLEATLRYRILPFLHVQASWNMLDPDGLTAFNPSQQFKYMLFAETGAFRVTVLGQYVHELYAGDNETLRMPDYHVLDLVASWQTPWVELYVKARNVLDRRYAVLPGYGAPGAHILAGVRYVLED